MTCSPSPRFARPRRFRQKRLLIVGCGACGLHILQQKAQVWRILATTTQASKLDALRAAGARPLQLDLDDPTPRRHWAALAATVIMMAPPQRSGQQDRRTRRLSQWLRQPPSRIVAPRPKPLRKRLIYISTSGVYGDRAGQWVDETHPLHPVSERAQRRLDAENVLREVGRRSQWSVNILRAPGIYSQERLPFKRLAAGTPCLLDEEDSYSNHISEVDLARAALMAAQRGRNQRVFNVCDDLPLKIGTYFDAVADAFQLPRPPRAPRALVQTQLSPLQWSFLQESRRLCNRRLRSELRLALRYPSVYHALSTPLALNAVPPATED